MRTLPARRVRIAYLSEGLITGTRCVPYVVNLFREAVMSNEKPYSILMTVTTTALFVVLALYLLFQDASLVGPI